MTNLQQIIRQLVTAAESEENELVKKALMTAAWNLELVDSILDYKPQSGGETCLGHTLTDVVDDKDTNQLRKLGFKPFKKSDVPHKKVLFVDNDGTRILFTRNKYNADYENDGPIVGKYQDEISLINECDYIIVARYPIGGDKNADYVDGAAFDIRGIQLTINANNQIEFLPPIPQNATIYTPTTGDWVKLNNLVKTE